MVEVITQGKARASKRDKAEEGLPLDIAVVGSMSTGKSYLALRYTDGRDMDAEALKQSVTLGGVRVKNLQHDGKHIVVYIWDTAGQERFRAVSRDYYRRARGIFLVYDVTSQESFDDLQSWYDELKKYARDDVVLALVGNKIDEQDAPRKVSYQEGHEFAQAHDSLFFETSALTGQRVEEAFTQLIARALQTMMANPPEMQTPSVKLDDPPADAKPARVCRCW